MFSRSWTALCSKALASAFQSRELLRLGRPACRASLDSKSGLEGPTFLNQALGFICFVIALILPWGKSWIRVQYISNMLLNWSMFCLNFIWIVHCLTFHWIPFLYVLFMMNVSDSTFVLKIGARYEGLHDWSGTRQPPGPDLFHKFSEVKSYPSTNYRQLCSSANVTQKSSFRVLPSFPLPCWPEVHGGSSPHFSLTLQYSAPQSSWTLWRFPPGETLWEFLCWELTTVLLSLLRETLRITQERLSASHHTATKNLLWRILEKVVFHYHENSSELCTF